MLCKYKPKILLVEDQLIAQNIATMIFKSCGCYFDVAENGHEALDYSRKYTYDLILMDIGLPDKNGLTVTKEIRAREFASLLNKTPIVGLSVHTPKTTEKQAMEAGMDGYFVKPMTTNMCKEILNQFTGISTK
jgi:CheY-like chemotaxis protein